MKTEIKNNNLYTTFNSIEEAEKTKATIIIYMLPEMQEVKRVSIPITKDVLNITVFGITLHNERLCNRAQKGLSRYNFYKTNVNFESIN